jgi:PST family polysaccharide transporter
MSLQHRVARGALWTMVASIAGRAVGALGTLVITRFLEPQVIGEVTDATIICMSASWITIWGFGQYTVVKGRGDVTTEVRWHATVAYLGLGALSLGLVAVVGGWFTPLLDAPHAAVYIPGMALAIFIRRAGAMPERVLTMRLDFRASGLALALGEIVYTVVAVSLAAVGAFPKNWAGMSIVIGNLAQSSVVVLIFIRAAGIRSWAAPTRLRAARFREMLRFGMPLALEGMAHQVSCYWDNLTISHFFGASGAGIYNMAYNLADIPAAHLGEQVALVLLPSMAELPPSRRPEALERASALLAIVIFPLAFGLGLVAHPLIATILPAGRWQAVAPLLAVLSVLSIFRPISWVLSAYMVAESKTNRLMFLEVGKACLLLGGIAVLARFGLVVAGAAVGIAFGAMAIAGVALVAREGPSPWRLVSGFLQPFAACGVMTAAVWLTAHALPGGGTTHPALVLIVETVVGAAVYIVAMFVIAAERSRELLSLLRKALARA